MNRAKKLGYDPRYIAEVLERRGASGRPHTLFWDGPVAYGPPAPYWPELTDDDLAAVVAWHGRPWRRWARAARAALRERRARAFNWAWHRWGDDRDVDS